MLIENPKDVTREVLDCAEQVAQDWFGNEVRIDWSTFFWYLEGMITASGEVINIPPDEKHPVKTRIINHIRKIRRLV